MHTQNGTPQTDVAMTQVRTTRKRDGVTIQPFDTAKLKAAISMAWKSCFDVVDEKAVNRVINTVLSTLTDETVGVETVQDAVETALMHHKQFAVAKAYILYRHQRSEARQAQQLHPDPKAVSDYIHASKYARYVPELKRREIYSETVARVEGMHLAKYPALAAEIKEAFDMVREQRVLPSMRSMQFGGEAILANNNRIYNCSFSLVDRLDVFSEAMFLLLSGCGVGYSVQFDHVEKLPVIPYIDRTKIRHHVVKDTIEGWADALKSLISSYMDGVNLEISYHRVRPAGTPLITSGGKAPGHLKLKDALERIRGVLSSVQGRKLRPVECHRIMCHAADAVLSGGIRRSAMICLFSLDDSEMMNVKTGNWYVTEPWLANSNNSVVLKRDDVRKKQFKRIFQMTRQWGEPGFYFTSDYDYGTNPCCEIGLDPRLLIDAATQGKLAARGVEAEVGSTHTGWAFCNLCEINAAKMASLEDFMRAARAATLIGTLQATYTAMPYLGWVSETLAERDALLGIGMTGMLDSPKVACDPEYQRQVATKIKEWNAEFAAILGIQPAARTTCVKPSGTTSLELGCVASGHHAHHAQRYIRRVTADELEHVFQAFKAANPHMCVRKPDGKWVIEFPVEAPEGAIVKDDIQAIPFLEMVQSTQQNWVLPGTARPEQSPGLNHNVSNTATVQTDEWDKVADYLWENREFFTGVSMLASTGDKDYAFAPNEAITTVADESRWNAILAGYKPVNYMLIVEASDDTNLSGEAACAGGACLI
jgi:ribonucleoside-diphosphate reductase alpha chain